MSDIPAQLLEASNGTLWMVMWFASVGAGVWLVKAFRNSGYNWLELYLEEKASIALCLTFGAMAVRQFNFWVIEHLRNHGHMVSWNGSWQTGIHIVGTLLAVVGVMCWLRCTLPEQFGWRGWAILTTVALAFGVLMAL